MEQIKEAVKEIENILNNFEPESHLYIIQEVYRKINAQPNKARRRG